VIKELDAKTSKNDLFKFVKIVRQICFPEIEMNGLEFDETFGEDVSPTVPQIVVSAPDLTELTDLKSENEKLVDANSKIKQDLQRLNIEYNELSSQLMDAVQESDDLKIKFQELEKENSECLEKLMELEQMKLKVEAMEKTDQESKSLIAEFELICEKIVEIQDKLEPTEDETDSGNKHMKTLNNLMFQLESFKNQFNQLKEETSLDHEKHQDLDSRLKESLENCRQLEERLSQVQHELDVVRKNLENAESKIECSVIESSLLEKPESLEVINEKLLAEINEKNGKIKDLEDSIMSREQELENEIKELKAGLKDIMTFELENTRLKTVEKEFNTLKKSYDWKQNECKKNTDDIARLKKLNASLREEIEKYQQKLENVQLLKNLLESFDGSLESRLKHLSEMIGEKADKLEVLENLVRKMTEISKTQPQKAELQRKIQEFETLVAGQTDEILKKTEALQEASLRIQELQNEISESSNDQEIEELSKKLNEAYIKIRILEETNEKIQELKDENQKLEELLKNFESEQQCKKLEDLNEAQQMNANLLETNAQLRTEINDSSQKIQQLEAEISNLSVENSKIQDLEAELIQVKVAKSTSDGRILELEKLLESAEQKHEKNEESFLKVKNDKELLEQQMLELAETLTNVQKSLKEEENDLEENYKELKMEKSLVESQKSALESANSELEKNLLALETEKNEMLGKMAGLESSLESEKSELSKCREKILQLDKEMMEMSEKVSELVRDNDDLSKQLIDKTEISEKFQKNIENLNKQLENAEFATLQLRQDKNVLDAECTNKQSSLILKDERIKELENALSEKTNEYQEFRVRYKRRSFDVDVKISNLEIQINDLIQKNGAIELEKSSVQAELKKWKNDYLYLVEKQIPELKQEKEHYSRKNAALSEERAKLEADIKNLDLKVAQMQEENADFKKKIEAQISENFVHNQTIAQLRTENDDLNKQLEEVSF
jgi:chromosome segregation ATPase